MMIHGASDLHRRRERGLVLQRDGNTAGLPELRIALLGTFNLELLVPFLQDSLASAGFYARVYLGPFGQIAQEILREDSGLYAHRPDIVVVVPAAEDVLRPLFQECAAGENTGAAAAGELGGWLQTVLAWLPSCVCLVTAFGSDRVPSAAVLPPSAPLRGQREVEDFLRSVRELGRSTPRIVVVDWDWHARQHGLAAFTDDRLWYAARMRLNLAGSAALADLLARHVRALRCAPRKLVVFDLDDTIWGGVVGEVGVSGVVLGDEQLGLCFQDFQRELLKLRNLGVLLAACSKNEPADAWQMFDAHPAMVLRREHLAAARVNWEDKAENVAAIARELNLGLDAVVFLDDNPREREWMNQRLPEVLTPELPADPAERVRFLQELDCFDRVEVTADDRRRADNYQLQARRAELKQSAASLQEFLASLQQQVTIARLSPATLTRAAQLCQRTNQFNLTTRRYSTAELEALLADAAAEAYTLSVRDRFGEDGIVGLGIVRFQDEVASIDTLLLSCRALGRNLENELVTFLGDRAAQRGAARLVGLFIPSARNAQTAGFYPRLGFAPAGEGRFELPLPATVGVAAGGASCAS